MLRYLYIVVILLFSSSEVFPQNNSIIKLNKEIYKLKADISIKHASYGILIKNISSNKIISELNPEQSLIPASVMKVPVTAAALSIIGSGYRFSTSLGYSGTIDREGTLNGNIYIVGGGDPSFGTTRFDNEYSTDSIFEKWHKAIKLAGIKKVDGSVIADASIFDDELIPSAWLWDDMGNYYGAGACGLNINENGYKVTFQPAAKEGDIAKVLSFDPELSYLNISNKVTTGKAGSGDNVIIYGSPYSISRIFEGTVPADKPAFEVKGSMPDPSYYCAYALHYFLLNKNIICSLRPNTVRVLRQQKGYTKPQMTNISTHLSPTLEDIIDKTNIHSINSYAEAILKMTGYIALKEGSTNGGIKAVKDFWKSKTIDTDGLVMKDGSGLSPNDRISAGQLASMMEYIVKDKTISRIFLNSLPVAGVTGSIKDNFKGTAAENNLRAKSGYMNNARAYTGVVKDKKGEEIVFAIMINNFDDSPKALKAKIEKILVKVAEIE
jgi:serine-type D-Ala-D-Ala carboxypeptidase/endopeptidase (penicillin-binding protein 4)